MVTWSNSPADEEQMGIFLSSAVLLLSVYEEIIHKTTEVEVQGRAQHYL